MKWSSIYLIAKIFLNGNAQGWQPSQKKASLRPHEQAHKTGHTFQRAILQNVPIPLKSIYYLSSYLYHFQKPHWENNQKSEQRCIHCLIMLVIILKNQKQPKYLIAQKWLHYRYFPIIKYMRVFPKSLLKKEMRSGNTPDCEEAMFAHSNWPFLF